jgi:glucokinase
LDEQGSVLAKEQFPVPHTTDVDEIAVLLQKKVRALAASAHVEETEIGFCGIGVPGSVAEDRLTVCSAPNLGWIDFPLGQCFQAKTGYRVQLIQDAKAAAWAEYCLGAGKGKDLLCITLGTGIGTGIVLNGNIYEGALRTAGELGHVPFAEKGRACGCGQNGCMECYAAGKGLLQTAQELYGPHATVQELFEKRRQDAGFLVPGKGLCLEEVVY